MTSARTPSTIPTSDIEYTPHHYDRSFPIYEVQPVQQLSNGMSRELWIYSDKKENMLAVEIVVLTSDRKIFGIAQRLYAEDRKDYPNWKIFEGDELIESAIVQYEETGGIKNGCYEFHYRDGVRAKSEYYQEYEHGKKIIYYQDGSIETATCVKDRKQGKAECILSDGAKEVFYYIDNERQGDASLVYPDGRVDRYKYKNNQLEGRSVCKLANGITEEFYYKAGIVHGESIIKYPNGDTEYQNYIDGKREGLSRIADITGRIKKYMVYIDNEMISSFLPDKGTHLDLKDTAKELMAPVHDIKMLYDEALQTMTQQKVNDNDIIDMAQRMQPRLASKS